MTTFALIHGAGDSGWYWHLVEPALRERGYDVVAPDLPADESANLQTYADTVIEAIGDRTGVVVVAQSFGAFTAPLVSDRIQTVLLMLVAAMIPRRASRRTTGGRTPGTRRPPTSPQDDVIATYYHDVSPELAAEALRRGREHPSGRAGREPWPLRTWPDVPTRVLLCREDRLFTPSFLRRVSRERLGITPDEIDSGHSVALSHPEELADRLSTYVTS